MVLFFAWSAAQPFSVSTSQRTLGERHDNCSAALPEIYEPKSSLSSAPQHKVMVHPRRPRGPCPFSDFQPASHGDTGYNGPAHLIFWDLEKNGITDMVSIILLRQPLPWPLLRSPYIHNETRTWYIAWHISSRGPMSSPSKNSPPPPQCSALVCWWHSGELKDSTAQQLLGDGRSTPSSLQTFSVSTIGRAPYLFSHMGQGGNFSPWALWSLEAK